MLNYSSELGKLSGGSRSRSVLRRLFRKLYTVIVQNDRDQVFFSIITVHEVKPFHKFNASLLIFNDWYKMA